MIKTVISLIIAAICINAIGRTGMAAWKYYQLKDHAQQLVVFGSHSSTNEIQRQILERADELEIPLEPGGLDVRRDGPKTYVDAFYTQPVELFPRFVYPLELSFSVDAFAASVAPPDSINR